jgi:RNA polymerase sigma factor (sigma-70 family)
MPASLPQLFDESLTMIPDAVRRACRKYRYQPNQLEFSGLVQRMIVKLFINDYVALRSFDHRASLKTWLQKIADNLVNRYVQQQRRNLSLEEFSTEVFASKATQEEQVISEEQKEMQEKRLKAALPKLTPRQRMLFDLLCRDDLDDQGIAKLMGVKLKSIYELRSKLIRKLQRLLEEDDAN